MTTSVNGKLCLCPASECNPWPERLNVSVKHLLTDEWIPLIYDPQLKAPVEYETAMELGRSSVLDLETVPT